MQRKVLYGVLAGAVIAILMWIGGLILGKPVPITPEQYGALQTLIVFGIQWWVKNHPELIPAADSDS